VEVESKVDGFVIEYCTAMTLSVGDFNSHLNVMIFSN
jgi:hypothetical protein